MIHLGQVVGGAVVMCRGRHEKQQYDEHQHAHNAREWKRIEVAEQPCRSAPSRQHSHVHLLSFHYDKQRAKGTIVLLGPLGKSLSGYCSILRHQADPLHTCVVRQIDHAGHVLKIYVCVAPNECHFLNTRQVDPG